VRCTVFVSFFEAFPPASGAASVTYGLARFTCGERFLVQLGGRSGRGVTSHGVCVITLPGGPTRIGKVLRLRRHIERMVECCRELGPDRIVLEGASWALYHWMLLRRLREALPSTPVIYHAHNVEYAIRAQRNGALVRRITRWAEGRLFRHADLATVVSEVDREQIEALYGVRPTLLPNGVDADRFAVLGEAELDTVRRKYGLGRETVLFMGMYAYRPNRQAIDRLVASIFPGIRERRPEARLLIIGGHVPHRRPWLINPGLLDTEEVPAVIRACAVGVAPILAGSGTRLKILEYAAAGLPVVATRKGAEGLHLADGREILLADDDPSFTECTVRILSDGRFARNLAAAGQSAVRARYGWPQLVERFWSELAESRWDGA